MTNQLIDPIKVQKFDEQTRARGIQASEALPRTNAERMRWHPPFIFEGEEFRFVTEPNVKAVNALTEHGKVSGLFPDLFSRLLKLRIRKSDLREGVSNYLWRVMEPSADTISYEEWVANLSKTKYSRRDSSCKFEAVTTSAA